MAAPDLTLTRSGSNNGGGDAVELFLKVFAGEVLRAFRTKSKTQDKHMIRTISSGKQASFPAWGIGSGGYHTPGTMLVGSSVNHSERIVNIDGLLVADRSLATLDEAMNHYDVRSILAEDMAQFLAKTWDKNVLRKAIQAARAAATVTGLSGGSQIFAGSTVVTDGDVLYAAIKEAAQTFDEKDIPDEDRYCFLSPELYYLLLDADKVVNQDFTEGTNGGVNTGRVRQVAGITIVSSNNVPNDVVNASGVTTYNGTYTDSVAAVFHKSAVGTVKLMDLAVESEYLIQNQGWLMVAKYAMGTDILRPEAAIEISKAAS